MKRIIGKWSILENIPSRKFRHKFVLCLCVCGTKRKVLVTNLIYGRSKSCGCFKRSEHKAKNPLLKRMRSIWRGMNERCGNPKNISFADYGKRGIYVCRRWKKFENFLNDMGPTHDFKLSIDRIDNNREYSPENCRWATVQVQLRNKRNNRFYLDKTFSEWAKILGVNRNLITNRVKNGWSVKSACTIPRKFSTGSSKVVLIAPEQSDNKQTVNSVSVSCNRRLCSY